MHSLAMGRSMPDVDVAIGQGQTQGMKGRLVEPGARAMGRHGEHDFSFVWPEVERLHDGQRGAHAGRQRGQGSL